MPRRPAAPLVALALGAVALGPLAACDVVQFPKDAPAQATYYVSTNRLRTAGRAATTVAVEYVTPDGVRTDTVRGALTSWSRVYERGALAEFRLKATNLTAPLATDTARVKDTGFVGVVLMLDGEIVARDSSRTVAEASN